MLTLTTRVGGTARFTLETPDDTAELGRKIAAVLRPGMTLLLRGALGAGKTTLVREICGALGWHKTSSPSFAIVNEYDRAKIPVAHADLYRLENVDARDFGFDEYLDDGWVLIIEWPEHLARGDFDELWRCSMSVSGTRRRFDVSARGKTAEEALSRLEKLCP